MLIRDLFVEYYKLQQTKIYKKMDYEHFYNKSTPKYKQAGFMNLILENVPLIFGDRVVEQGFRKAFKGDWGIGKTYKTSRFITRFKSLYPIGVF